MGQERSIEVDKSPIRCPYCHANVILAEEKWVACESCLARHHEECWGERGKCATCSHPRTLAPRPAPPPLARSAPARPPAFQPAPRRTGSRWKATGAAVLIGIVGGIMLYGARRQRAVSEPAAPVFPVPAPQRDLSSTPPFDAIRRTVATRLLGAWNWGTPGQSSSIERIVVAPSGRTVAASFASGRATSFFAELGIPNLIEPGRPALAYSPLGDLAALGQSIELWRDAACAAGIPASTSALVLPRVGSLHAFAQGGSALTLRSSAGSRTIRVDGTVTALTLSPDEKYVVASVGNDESARLVLFSAQGNHHVLPVRLYGPASSLAFFADGKLGVATRDLHVVDASLDGVVRTASLGLEQAAFSPDGRWLLGMKGQKLVVANVAEGTEIDTIDLAPLREPGKKALAWGADRTFYVGLASGLALRFKLEGEPSREVAVALEAEWRAALADEPLARKPRVERLLLSLAHKELSQGPGVPPELLELRQLRPKAAIPFLLERIFSLAHDPDPRERVEYARTLERLTGKVVELPGTPDGVRSTVESLWKEWWLPNKGTIRTDVGAMAPAERTAVLTFLLDDAIAATNRRLHDTSRRLEPRDVNEIAAVLDRGFASTEISAPDEIGSRVVPALLDLACTPRYRWAAVPLLAELHRRGTVRLQDVLKEEKSGPAHVVLALELAMHLAGEKVPEDRLLDLVLVREEPEVRLAATVLLGLHRGANASAKEIAALVSLCDGSPLGTAAVFSLRRVDSDECIRQIQERLLSPSALSYEKADALYEALSTVRIDFAMRVIARAVADPQKDDGPRLRGALVGFGELTKRNWLGEHRRSEDVETLRNCAKVARAAWKGNWPE